VIKGAARVEQLLKQLVRSQERQEKLLGEIIRITEKSLKLAEESARLSEQNEFISGIGFLLKRGDISAREAEQRIKGASINGTSINTELGKSDQSGP